MSYITDGMSINTLMSAVNGLVMEVLAEHTVDDCGISNQAWFYDLNETLENAGLQLLGTGHFAATYRTPDGLAVKIGFKREDSGASYAAYCRSMVGNKCTSKVLGIRRFELVYIVVMPCYDTYRGAPERTVNVLHLRAMYVIVYKTFHNYDEVAITVDQCIKSACVSFANTPKVVEEYKECLTRGTFRAELEELFKEAQEVHRFFNGIASFDIHEGNVMLEHDLNTATGYRMIITDPVSWSNCGEDEISVDYIASSLIG